LPTDSGCSGNGLGDSSVEVDGRGEAISGGGGGKSSIHPPSVDSSIDRSVGADSSGGGVTVGGGDVSTDGDAVVGAEASGGVVVGTGSWDGVVGEVSEGEIRETRVGGEGAMDEVRGGCVTSCLAEGGCC